MKEKYSSDKGMNMNEKHVKDYQIPKDNFAGVEMGKTTKYVERSEKTLNKVASGIKRQAYKGKYD